MSIRRDAYWTAADTVINSGLGFVLRLIVARVLAPEDFGIAMLAVTVVSVLQVINDFGLTSALIQRDERDVTPDFVNTTFTASLLITLVVAILMVGLVAPLAARFYGESQLLPLLIVLGMTLLPSPFTTVASALLYRQREFKKVAIVKVAGNALGMLMAILLLLLNPSPWVIVMQLVITVGVVAGGVQVAAKWRYRLAWRREHLNSVFNYSGKIFVNDTVVSLSAHAGVFIIGRALSVTEAGLFALAVLLTDDFRKTLMSILNRVMFVHYSANKADMALLRDTYLATLRWNCRLIFPVMTAFALFGPQLSVVFLGEAWSRMGLVIGWLCLAVMIHAAGGTTSTLFKAIGRPGLDMTLFLVTTPTLLFPGMIAGAYLMGIEGVAIATAVTRFLAMLTRQIVLDRLIGNTFKKVFCAVAYLLLLQTPIALAWAISQLLPPHSWLIDVALAGLGCAIYALMEFPRVFPDLARRAGLHWLPMPKRTP